MISAKGKDICEKVERGCLTNVGGRRLALALDSAAVDLV